MVCWIGISRSKFHNWRSRYGKVNEHNAWIPRDAWLTPAERQAILNYYQDHPLEGYRLVKMLSWVGATVLDPFNGAGTSGLACQKLDRKYIGIELSKKYCQISVDRWTGTKKVAA